MCANKKRVNLFFTWSDNRLSFSVNTAAHIIFQSLTKKRSQTFETSCREDVWFVSCIWSRIWNGFQSDAMNHKYQLQ